MRFDIFGADVVIANKMESNGTPGKINVSGRTKRLLEDLETCNYSFEENITIKLPSVNASVNSYFLNYETLE